MKAKEVIQTIDKLDDKDWENMKKHLTSGKDADISRELLMWEQHHQIGGIYLGVEWMMSIYKNMYYDEDGNEDKDYTLFDFLKEIWEGVNKSCGGNHDFTLNTDNRPDGKIVRIIDMQADSQGVDLENVHELKIQSLDSTVRDIAYNTTIPSSLSSTIAIAAQNPDSVDSLDKVSFAALNKGIRDRFSTNVINNKAGFFGGDAQEEVEQKAKWNQTFDKHLLAVYEALYIFDHQNWMQILGETAKQYRWWEYVLLNPIFSAPAKITKELNRNFGGVLRDLLYYQYTINDNQYLRDEAKPSIQSEVSARFNGSLKSLHQAINYFSKVYGSTDNTSEVPQYYRGQPYTGSSRRTSSIIPLKFNAKMDGISGLVIGNVFKIPKNRLPMAYGGDDIHFIVMGEQQEISAGQDWTTTITGQITLLGNPNISNNTPHKLWLQSWKDSKNLGSNIISDKALDNINVDGYDKEKNYEYNNKYGDYVTTPETSLIDPLATMKPISSGYGPRPHPITGKEQDHNSIDIPTSNEKIPVYAVWDGVIIKADSKNPGCGGQIQLSFREKDYGDGRKGYPIPNEKGRTQLPPRIAQYCHLSEFDVDENDIVKKGQKIGTSGGGPNDLMKGNSTARHLHFSLWDINYNPLPPAPWLPDNRSWWTKSIDFLTKTNQPL